VYISFRPGDGKRLAIGLGLALKEAEKAQKSLSAIAIIPAPPQLLDLRAEFEGASTEVSRWLDESGDAPKMVDIVDERRRKALHIAAFRYNTDTEKLRERKHKQGRDTSSEDEEIERTGRLIDWLLGRAPDKAIADARKLLGDDDVSVTVNGERFSGPNAAEALTGALAEVVTGAHRD